MRPALRLAAILTFAFLALNSRGLGPIIHHFSAWSGNGWERCDHREGKSDAQQPGARS